MRSKLLNATITILAIVGVVGFIGAVGNMDYMVAIGNDYPLSETIKTMAISVLCVVPAMIREVL